MIDLIGLPLPKGNVIILTQTIGGATSNVHNPKHTDVYTDFFPNGITVAVSIEEFHDIWLGHLLADLEIEEIVEEDANGD